MIMKQKTNMTWYDVTLYQFKMLQDVMSVEDETERIVSIAEILLGKDVTNLPLKEFNEQAKQLVFLTTDVPVSNPPKKLEVNGRKYYMDCLLGNITTAQYVDYTNHCNTNDMAKMLSVFVIPEGHKYNDGYDMLEVMNDMNSLPIPIVNSAAFFFSRQLQKFTEIFQRCLRKKIKKQKLTKEQKQMMIGMVENLTDLESSLLS